MKISAFSYPQKQTAQEQPPLNPVETTCKVIIPIYIHIDTLKVLMEELRDTRRIHVDVCELVRFVIDCESDVLGCKIKQLNL